MRNLRIITIALFLIVSIAFSVLYFYDYTVSDNEAPMIICDGVPLEVSVKATDAELCAGLRAHDNIDGDISDRIVVRKISQLIDAKSAIISYAVFDSASNCCTFSRNVTYTDYEAPRFTLSQPLIYNVNGLITLEDRLTAHDVIDGDITNRMKLSSTNLGNTDEGEYPIMVQVTNSTGDTALVTLKVLIQNYTSLHPEIYLDEYLVYVDADNPIELEDLREHIVSVRASSHGASVDPSEVLISGEINYESRGSNFVTFSYTNESGLTYSVLLTVVVE
ncbi:MAG: hypothetical protein E7434_09140 [Ruminococcaceae bacterium]|nr:hypothetical protein [Oscillospiraceae bacterium]